MGVGCPRQVGSYQSLADSLRGKGKGGAFWLRIVTGELGIWEEISKT